MSRAQAVFPRPWNIKGVLLAPTQPGAVIAVHYQGWSQYAHPAPPRPLDQTVNFFLRDGKLGEDAPDEFYE